MKWECDGEKKVWNNLKEFYDIVALNVGKNMWYPDYGTIQDYADARHILENNNEVIVYANSSTGNTHYNYIPETYDSAWQDVDQSQYENYNKIEYVPLCGSDQLNIPKKLKLD